MIIYSLFVTGLQVPDYSKRKRLSLLLWKAQSVILQPEALEGSAGRL